MPAPSSPDSAAPGAPLEGAGLVVAVLATRWYPEVLTRLLEAARRTLLQHGVAAADIGEVEVPGAYELPQAAAWVARHGAPTADGRRRPVDAIVALGCVLRGETPHFDLVARAAGDGLLRVALDTGVPVGLGVITADTAAQAEARSQPLDGRAAGTKGGNKGVEAADAALRMAVLRRRLAGGPSTGPAAGGAR